MNCIVIEDEPAAQYILERYISQCPGLTWAGTFRDAVNARIYIEAHSVDLLFLDINLPEISGISFLRSLVNPPFVIFTTAYSRYAIDGFELEIVDFLLKPFSYERFIKAVNKAKDRLNSGTTNHIPAKISVRADRKIYQLGVNEIEFIETCGDYVTVYYSGKKLLVHGTLKDWEIRLKEFPFMKIHRTIIVNLEKIDRIDGNLVILDTHSLPVADSNKALLLERMVNKTKEI
jgi:DNA-binding LytR/AlgR family response regulator